MLAMMPLNQASMAAVSREEAGDAAGLYNMARNLGGSVGLALLGVYIDRRNALHDAVIATLSPRTPSPDRNTSPPPRPDSSHNTATRPTPTCRHWVNWPAEMQQQAAVITYSETFYVLGVALLLCIPIALLLRKPKPGAGPMQSGGH
jgi:DHA2 family multidrug resistance protein